MQTNQSITDKVKSFEDACAMRELHPSAIIGSTDTKDEAAYKKLKLLIEVLNEGWKPNWEDTDERKWFPWFDMSSGFGFSHSNCVRWLTATSVGSRLCFKSEALSDYAAKQFIDIYRDFLTL